MCRAKVGVMRCISMAVLRETARHVTRGLDVVGPQCVQQARTASRDQSTAAEADHDEGRHAIGSTDHTAGRPGSTPLSLGRLRRTLAAETRRDG